MGKRISASKRSSARFRRRARSPAPRPSKAVRSREAQAETEFGGLSAAGIYQQLDRLFFWQKLSFKLATRASMQSSVRPRKMFGTSPDPRAALTGKLLAMLT